MKAIKQTLLALALAGAFTNANATPVDWTLTDVKFADNTNGNMYYQNYFDISGSFTFDVDTGVFSNVNLLNIATRISYYPVTSTSIFQYGSVATSISGDANQISFYVGDDIKLSFASALTNTGGTVGLASGTLGGCCSLIAGQNIIGVPQASATAVPEPEAYALMLTGLGLVGFAARRQLA